MDHERLEHPCGLRRHYCDAVGVVPAVGRSLGFRRLLLRCGTVQLDLHDGLLSLLVLVVDWCLVDAFGLRLGDPDSFGIVHSFGWRVGFGCVLPRWCSCQLADLDGLFELHL